MSKQVHNNAITAAEVEPPPLSPPDAPSGIQDATPNEGEGDPNDFLFDVNLDDDRQFREFDGDDVDGLIEITPQEQAERLREFVEALPLLSPAEIYAKVAELGYKGQEEPRRALALMAYRHIRRLKRIHVDGEERRNLPPKQNTLLAGPTGSGKTFLVESLFQQLFHLPTLIVDVTSFTESGYVGDDVQTILTRLVHASEGDLMRAQCGVICLDEFDKLASSTSNARFAGEGTTKDVSGYGVQRELLKMLEGTELMVPMDYGFSAFGQRTPFSTRDIPFIACGAFSGMNEMLKQQKKSLGFGGQDDRVDGEAPVLEEVEGFQRYGFLPELMGRFGRIVRFTALSAETLRQILIENVVPQFTREFAHEGLQLIVTESALELIVERSVKRGTGARGLHASLIAAVEHAAFENFHRVTNAAVAITAVKGQLLSEVRKRA